MDIQIQSEDEIEDKHLDMVLSEIRKIALKIDKKYKVGFYICGKPSSIKN